MDCLRREPRLSTSATRPLFLAVVSFRHWDQYRERVAPAAPCRFRRCLELRRRQGTLNLLLHITLQELPRALDRPLPRLYRPLLGCTRLLPSTSRSGGLRRPNTLALTIPEVAPPHRRRVHTRRRRRYSDTARHRGLIINVGSLRRTGEIRTACLLVPLLDPRASRSPLPACLRDLLTWDATAARKRCISVARR